MPVIRQKNKAQKDPTFTQPMEVSLQDFSENDLPPSTNVNHDELVDIDLDGPTVPELPKVLTQRKGRMPFSDASQDIQAGVFTDQKKDVAREFENLKRDALAYAIYVQKSVEKLENTELEAGKKQSPKRQAALNIALIEIETAKNMIEESSINSDSAQLTKTMYVLKDSIKNINKYADEIAEVYHVRKRTEFDKDRAGLLSKVIDRFLAFIDKVKSLFRTTDRAAQVQIVNELQHMKAINQQELKKNR